MNLNNDNTTKSRFKSVNSLKTAQTFDMEIATLQSHVINVNPSLKQGRRGEGGLGGEG